MQDFDLALDALKEAARGFYLGGPRDTEALVKAAEDFCKKEAALE